MCTQVAYIVSLIYFGLYNMSAIITSEDALQQQNDLYNMSTINDLDMSAINDLCNMSAINDLDMSAINDLDMSAAINDLCNMSAINDLHMPAYITSEDALQQENDFGVAVSIIFV